WQASRRPDPARTRTNRLSTTHRVIKPFSSDWGRANHRSNQSGSQSPRPVSTYALELSFLETRRSFDCSVSGTKAGNIRKSALAGFVSAPSHDGQISRLPGMSPAPERLGQSRLTRRTMNLFANDSWHPHCCPVALDSGGRHGDGMSHVRTDQQPPSSWLLYRTG